MLNHFSARRIDQQLTTAYPPHQNGVAEQMNQTWINLVPVMLGNKKIAKSLRAKALCTGSYTGNRVTNPNGPLPNNKTPHSLEKTSSKSFASPHVWVKILVYDSRGVCREAEKRK